MLLGALLSTPHICLTLAPAPAPAPAGARQNKLPNILHILLDDFGWADAGWHRPAGYTDIQTPNMLNLVREGVELDPGSICFHFRAAIIILLCKTCNTTAHKKQTAHRLTARLLAV